MEVVQLVKLKTEMSRNVVREMASVIMFVYVKMVQL